MPIQFNIDIRGVPQLQQRLTRFSQQVGQGGGRTDLMTRIGQTTLRWVDRNFASGGGLVGGWAPLRPSTIFARRGGSSVPLSDIGAAGLRGSFTYAVRSEHEVVVGTAKQIAKYHQEGTGPYTIRPKKPGGVLAFLMPPSSSTTTRRIRTSLRRRSKGAPRVGIVSARAAKTAGLALPSGVGDLQSVMFSRVVHHPGLPARRMLPQQPEILPEIKKTMQDWLSEKLQQTGLAGGQNPTQGG